MLKKKLKFEKDESGNWFVVLPEYPGPHSDLQMVCGADTLLDIFAKGYDNIRFFIDEEPIEDGYVLKLAENHGDSGTYMFSDENLELSVWLCPVIQFVFGKVPSHIYFSPC